MSNSVITVIDATTHIPVTANVYFNGVGVGTTDGDGNAILTVNTGVQGTLVIKASNYQSYSGTYIGGQSVVIPLTSTTPATSANLQLTVNPESPAEGLLFTISNGTTPVNAYYTAGGITVPGLQVGQQSIMASLAGYNAISDLVTISAPSTSHTIVLIASSDSGLANKQQTAITTDPDTSTMLPTITPEQSPEYVAPDTGQGTYFTMTQARMYIGSLFIDELNGLQFALQDNKIPIYGYASRFYDAVAQGKSLVQGQFAINFISEGYLIMVLNEYLSKIGTGNEVPSTVHQQQEARLLTLTNQLSNPNGADPSWTPDMIAAAKKEVNNLAAALGPDAIALAKAGQSANVHDQVDSILGLPGGDYANALYKDVAFDIVLEYSGAGRVITRRLEGCYLISNESIMDQSGAPILDSYGFIARRLR